MRASAGELLDDERQAIRSFIGWDLVGTLLGLALVIFVNLFLGEALVWGIALTLVILVGCLVWARRSLAAGDAFRSLVLVAVGNWLIAVVVSATAPQLWPVMAITVLMPLVLAAPWLNRRSLAQGVAAATVVACTVSALGLIFDDDGVLPDLADELELALVLSAMAAQIAPIGLIVWGHNNLQQTNLARATALNAELRQAEVNLAGSRRRVVEAADLERRRIERDLHDGAQQRMVALGVRLRLLEATAPNDEQTRSAIAEVLVDLDDTVEELREFARGIYPPLLRTRGLADAIAAVVRRSGLTATTDLDDIGRLDPSSESALYFTATEAMTNIGKYAPDSRIRVTLARHGDVARLRVVDNGPGFSVDEVETGQGTVNMGDRLAAVDGRLTITSKPGQGTTVEAEVPYLTQDPTRPT